MNKMIHNKYIVFGSVFFAGFICNAIFNKTSTRLEIKSSEQQTSLSKIENALRTDLAGFEKEYDIELRLVRVKNQLVLRLWDDQVFGINDWSVSKKGQKLIKEISTSLQEVDGKVKFEISCHYDSVDPKVGSSEAVNKVAITTHRAAQIAGILAGGGLDMNRLYIKGYGDTKPLFKDRDQYGQYVAQAGELNRRLEIRVVQGAML